MIDQSLGPYKIVDELGSGGMGVVYLAEDSRLQRKVALKVLAQELGEHPKRLERFEREARAAAALNHPHIAAVFDIGSADGVHFMVQEYLEGDSLRQLLERRKLLLGEALSISVEIAKALSAAHAVGIVHRDIKPDNIFITSDGHAKVLDFGLAKLVEEDAEADSAAEKTMPDSIAGQIMGTPAYMAPEQANCEGADHRADIFAFGSVLYEMVSGSRSFDGRSTAETLYRVVHDEPQAPLSPTLPFELRRIIEKCQQKQPLRRYQSSADLVIDLLALRTDIETGNAVTIAQVEGVPGPATAIEATTLWPNRPGWLLVAAAVLVSVIGTWALLPTPTPVPAPTVRFNADLPADTRITRTERPVVAISPTGETLVVAANAALYARDLDDDDFRLIPGTEPTQSNGYAVSPAFSPDGAKVAFFVDGSIRCVPIEGDSQPTTLTSAEIPLSISWAADGYVYYSQGDGSAPSSQLFTNDGIWRVTENGGEPEEVVASVAGTRAVAPQLLPGGTWLLFSTASATDFVAEEQTVETVDLFNLSTGERRTIIEDGFGGHYVSSGHILYQREGGVWAMPFTLDGLEQTGGPFRVIDQVPSSYWAGTAYYAVSDNGTLVLPSLSIVQERNGGISWVNRDGTRQPIEVEPADNPRVNRAGDKIVAEVRSAESTHLWVHEIDSGSWSQLTDESQGAAPVWSSDGQSVFFMTADEEGPAVWQRPASLAGPARMIYRPDGHRPFPESTPDSGRFLIYSAGLPDQNDVWLLWLDGQGRAIPLTETPGISEEGAQVHPSGRWFAYTSRQSEQYDVFVRELSENGTVGRRFTISNGGGSEPMWSRDGNTLFYRVGSQMLAVNVTTEPNFRAGEAQVIMLEFPGDLPVLRADYDVAGDGRFLTSIPDAPWSSNLLEVVVNWGREVGLTR